MPNNTHKSAAVPFVNQKGERSMKRVKVERYVAGKKPSYAKDDDDEEYYTTDDEDGQEDEEYEEKERETSDDDQAHSRPADNESSSEDEDHDDRDITKPISQVRPKPERNVSPPVAAECDSDDEDDPRFRRLKQLQSKPISSGAAQNAPVPKIESKNIVIDEDEDEDEIIQRHTIARARTVEEPIGPQVGADELEQQLDVKPGSSSQSQRPRREETEDILKDLKLTGIKPKQSKIALDIAKAEESVKKMIEEARQQAIFTTQLHKKIEEDNKRELEKEALNKGDFGSNQINAVNTDDEDEEIAYEEWKLREIKRVLRDRSERLIEAKGVK